MLSPTPRTVLRLFLVLGGIGIFWLGFQDDNTTNIVIGVIAVALGAFGLLWELRSAKREASGSEHHREHDRESKES